MAEPFIPPKTVEALATPYAPGTRHQNAINIALPLLGNGMDAETVFRTLQTKFAPGLSEKELRDIVRWCDGRGCPATPTETVAYRRPVVGSPKPKLRPPVDHARWWLSNAEMNLEQFSQKSQLAIPEKKADVLCLALEMLWNGNENLNIVCAYVEDGGKAKPHGAGKTLTRDKWVQYVRSKGVPESKAGAWVRPNPCRPAGSGAQGAVTDSDILSWKYLLLESDVLPLPVQLALFAKLKLPIAAVTLSGGVSVHAWVNIGAKQVEVFSETVRSILTALVPFGIDQANKNPSRLSRLPEAVRTIGAVNGGRQTLLWLNPGRTALTEAELNLFVESLTLPAIEEKPFRQIIMDAAFRYDDLIANRGRLGVPTGFETLQKAMGGWKNASLNIIGATTGGGKTTLGLNLLNTALREKVGVALFSMEMTKEDICDMLFSLNAEVDRNHFNTGEFTPVELQRIHKHSLWMKDLPLWLDDSSTITVEQIRKQVLQLKAENRIGMVMIDYAQLVMPSNERDHRELQVASVARGLRMLAKDAQLPLLVLSQLNDEGKIRESRVLSHEASNVFRLTKRPKSETKMILHIDKGRKIKSEPIDLLFEARFCRIIEEPKITEDDLPPENVE